MDLRAAFELIWTFITVILRLFRIVPSEGPPPTLPPVSAVDVAIVTQSPGTGSPTISPTLSPIVSSTIEPTVSHQNIATSSAPIAATPVISATNAPVAATTNTPVSVPTEQPVMIPTVAPVIVTTSVPTMQPVVPVQVPSSNIESFVLVYAPTDRELLELQDGDIIDMGTLDGVSSLEFNVKVNPGIGIGEVLFAETGRREGTPPLAFCGDNFGNYNACTEITAGLNTVTVTPFDAVSNAELPTESISFEIIGAPSVPTGGGSEELDGDETAVDALGGRWIEIDPNADIEARHEACFVMVTNPTVGRRAVLIGGRGTKRTDIFDPVSRTWTFGPTTPAQLHHMQCVAAQGKVWIVAAWTDWYPKENNAEFVYVFDPATNEWSTRTPMPETRRRGAAAVIVSPDEQTIWVSHGNNGGHETGDHAVSLGYLDAYDIASDTWTAVSDDAPNPRDHTGGAFVNGRICVGGGRNGGELNWPEVAATDCYDLASGTWTEEAPIPDPRAGSSYGLSCDGKLLVAGGEGGGKAWNEVHAFDGTQWTTLAPLNVGRHGSGLAVDCVCNEIIIASGAANQGGGPEITSVEIYFPDGQEIQCIA